MFGIFGIDHRRYGRLYYEQLMTFGLQSELILQFIQRKMPADIFDELQCQLDII